MSFKGVLIVDDKSFNILRMDISFSQRIDSTGRPCANPEGGQISFSLESSSDSQIFMQWMLDPAGMKSGMVRFTKRDDEGSLKTIEFIDAYCVNYHESFSAQGSDPMVISLVITTRQLKIGEAELTKEWYDVVGAN